MLEQLALTGSVHPSDLELHLGDRLAVLGSDGSGASHLLRLLVERGAHPSTSWSATSCPSRLEAALKRLGGTVVAVTRRRATSRGGGRGAGTMPG